MAAFLTTWAAVTYCAAQHPGEFDTVNHPAWDDFSSDMVSPEDSAVIASSDSDQGPGAALGRAMGDMDADGTQCRILQAWGPRPADTSGPQNFTLAGPATIGHGTQDLVVGSWGIVPDQVVPGASSIRCARFP